MSSVGPVVVDTGVFVAVLSASSKPHVDPYADVLVGRNILISFVWPSVPFQKLSYRKLPGAGVVLVLIEL